MNIPKVKSGWYVGMEIETDSANGSEFSDYNKKYRQ